MSMAQNENKTLKDNQLRSQNSWDEKYATLLQKLDDAQDEKDNPKKQVIDIEVDELWVQVPKVLLRSWPPD